MKTIRAYFILSVCILFFSFGQKSKAELPDLPFGGLDISSVVQMVQGLSFGNFVSMGNLSLPSTIDLGNCSPEVTWNGTYGDMKFPKSSTCPISGNVRLNLLPLSASIRLEVTGFPGLEAIDLDVLLNLRRRFKTTTLSYQVMNGRLAIRPEAAGPLVEVAVNSAGKWMKNKTSSSLTGRWNFFDKATGAGYTLLEDLKQVKPNPAVINVQLCQLTGAVINQVDSGTLALCKDIKY
ncbi:MAG: hypothetical protein HY537_09845 [Deltaproteobacteria bacterium]|nr:hypothetical protein [Deltaproteobacteria bacterium]